MEERTHPSIRKALSENARRRRDARSKRHERNDGVVRELRSRGDLGGHKPSA